MAGGSFPLVEELFVRVVTAFVAELRPFTMPNGGVWPEHEVELVEHQIEQEQACAGAFAGLAQELDEGSEFVVLVEDGTAAIAPVEDVAAIAAQGCACGAWHQKGLCKSCQANVSEKYDVPLCAPPISPSLLQFNSIR